MKKLSQHADTYQAMTRGLLALFACADVTAQANVDKASAPGIRPAIPQHPGSVRMAPPIDYQGKAPAWTSSSPTPYLTGRRAPAPHRSRRLPTTALSTSTRPPQAAIPTRRRRRRAPRTRPISRLTHSSPTSHLTCSSPISRLSPTSRRPSRVSSMGSRHSRECLPAPPTTPPLQTNAPAKQPRQPPWESSMGPWGYSTP